MIWWRGYAGSRARGGFGPRDREPARPRNRETSLLSPPRPSRRVFEQDVLRQQEVADAIALGEVARFARGVALRDQLFDFGVEVLVALREDVEHGIHFHQRGVNSLRIRSADASGVHRDVAVA